MQLITAATTELRTAPSFQPLLLSVSARCWWAGWASGTPLWLATNQDKLTLGGDKARNNEFGFEGLELVGNVRPPAQ